MSTKMSHILKQTSSFQLQFRFFVTFKLTIDATGSHLQYFYKFQSSSVHVNMNFIFLDT